MMSKQEQGNTIPKVLMVSSAAFGIFSAINPYMAIPCAVAGLGANLLNEQTAAKTNASERLNKQLIVATRKALNATRHDIENSKNGSPSQLKIIDELSEEESQPQNLKDLIKKTESFQKYYCTEKDSNDIIHLFERNLGVQIADSPLLSQYFALTAQSFTVEKVQIISTLLDDNVKTIEQIVNLLNNQEAHIQNIEKIGVTIERRLDFFMNKVSQVLNEFTRIALAVCAFLVIGIGFYTKYDITVLIAVFASYGISNLVVASLIKGKYILDIPFSFKSISKDNLNRVRAVFSIVLPLILPLLCYFLLNYGIRLEPPITMVTIISLLPGSLICMLFRGISHQNKSILSESIVSSKEEKQNEIPDSK